MNTLTSRVKMNAWMNPTRISNSMIATAIAKGSGAMLPLWNVKIMPLNASTTT